MQFIKNVFLKVGNIYIVSTLNQYYYDRWGVAIRALQKYFGEVSP